MGLTSVLLVLGTLLSAHALYTSKVRLSSHLPCQPQTRHENPWVCMLCVSMVLTSPFQQMQDNVVVLTEKNFDEIVHQGDAVAAVGKQHLCLHEFQARPTASTHSNTTQRRHSKTALPRI